MKLRDEIGDLAAALSGVAADLKDKQDKLLAYARGLESVISRQTAELAHEKANLPVAVAERTAELKAANDDLGQQVAELSRRNHVITLFSRMNDFLQTSDTEKEAYSIIAETATQLFPKDSGAVYVLSASRDMLDAAVAWGQRPPANLVFFRRASVGRIDADRFISASVISDGVPMLLTANICMPACRCSRREKPWAYCMLPTARLTTTRLMKRT